MRTESWLLTH